MKDIAVVGNSEFTLGFRLAGIKNIVNTNNPQEELPRFLNNEDVGIVIIDDQTMGKLDEYIKEQVVNSISPVFVVVGKESKQDELRQMIIQSIGVDLMKNDE